MRLCSLWSPDTLQGFVLLSPAAVFYLLRQTIWTFGAALVFLSLPISLLPPPVNEAMLMQVFAKGLTH